MICNNCYHKAICKHYDYAMTNTSLVMDISNCDNHMAKTEEIKQETKEEIKTQPIPIVDTTREQESGYIDYSNKNTEPKISAIPVEINKVICDRCKREVPSTDVDNCNDCGRPICSDCGVANISSEGHAILTCEKCWSGAEDPDPNEVSKVTLSYGDDGKEWDLEELGLGMEESTDESEEE